MFPNVYLELYIQPYKTWVALNSAVLSCRELGTTSEGETRLSPVSGPAPAAVVEGMGLGTVAPVPLQWWRTWGWAQSLGFPVRGTGPAAVVEGMGSPLPVETRSPRN